MTRLAKRNRVLWINSIGNRKPTASVADFRRVIKKLKDFTQGHKKIHDRLHVYSPITVPLFSSAAARWINRKALQWGVRRICRRLGFRSPITWTFVPASAEVAGSLGEESLIYHCVDEFSEFTGTDKAAILEMERHLMEKSDCVIVSSDRLYATKHRHNANTFLVTHGVDVAHFRKACDPTLAVAAGMTAFQRPIIGFFGLIADWVDLELIRYLAVSRPKWTYVLIGKVTTDVRMLQDVANVHLLGQKTYDELPDYAKAFDVAILPFVVNELTLAANPLKLREYLAAGLPVVSSAIPEAEKLSKVLRIGRNRSDFLNQIQNILESGITGPHLSISKEMDVESWDGKVEELSRIFVGLRQEKVA